MTRGPRLLIATAFAVVATLVGPGVAPGPAAAAESCEGVWVIVEPRTLGGSTTKRCAPGAPATGLAALEGAGHRYTFVPRQAGMVCTIDARPDPCNGAPSEAYWAYYHAEAGASTWTYSTRGAGIRKPAPGTAEAWVFGAGSAPSTPPPGSSPAPKAPATGGDSTDGDSGSGGSSGGSSDGSGSSGGSTGGSGSTSGTGSSSGSGSSSGGSGGGSGSSGGAGSSSASGSRSGSSTSGSADPRASAAGSSAAGDAAPQGTDRAAVGTSRTARGAEDADLPSADEDERGGSAAGADEAEGAAVDPETGSPDDDRAPVALADDTVSVGGSGGAGRAAGTALAGTLAAGLAAAGLVRVRRRDPSTDAGVGG